MLQVSKQKSVFEEAEEQETAEETDEFWFSINFKGENFEIPPPQIDRYGQMGILGLATVHRTSAKQ